MLIFCIKFSFYNYLSHDNKNVIQFFVFVYLCVFVTYILRILRVDDICKVECYK